MLRRFLLDGQTPGPFFELRNAVDLSSRSEPKTYRRELRMRIPDSGPGERKTY